MILKKKYINNINQKRVEVIMIIVPPCMYIRLKKSPGWDSGWGGLTDDHSNKR